MRILLSAMLLLSVNVSFAQKTSPTETKQVDTSVFQQVEIEASVDMDQWIAHLTNNLQRPIERAARKGMQPGTYTVQVKFLVELDGTIADVHALNEPGFDLGKAAEKVVRTGPKWQPGVYKGKVVRSYHTQPITFVIQKG
ncbi:MAG: energy transducer TonB [Flavisolibacter sp.]